MSEMSIINTKIFSLSSNSGGSLDPIRQSIQSYWIYDGSSLIYDTENTYDKDAKEAIAPSLNFKFIYRTPVKQELIFDDSSLILTSPKDLIEITPRYGPSFKDLSLAKPRTATDSSDPEKVFDSYIEASILPYIGVINLDYKIDLDAPIQYASNIQNRSRIAGTVNFVYNYGLNKYERFSESVDSDSQLNNFYTFDPFSRTRRRGGPFRASSPIPITKKTVSRTLSISANPSEEIQDFFMNSEGFLQALELQEKKDAFPFYNEVYFTNPTSKLIDDPFKEALKESGLLLAFCDLMNREDYKFSQDTNSTNVIQNFSFANSYIASTYESPAQRGFVEFSTLKYEKVKLYDIPQMLKIMHDVISPKTSPIAGGSLEPLIQQDTRTLRAKGFLTDGEQADYRLDVISKISTDENTRMDYENALDDLVATINELLGNVPPTPESYSAETKYTAFDLPTTASSGKPAADKSSSETRYTAFDLPTTTSGTGGIDTAKSFETDLTTGDLEIEDASISRNYRSYTDILSNKRQTYQSDVLFYRIKKFEQGSDTPIQNFWIPAEKSYKGIRYIDTQVKYGKMYRYEIHAFKFVIGTEYTFNERDAGKINFSQDLENYEKEVSGAIEKLKTLSGFRKEAQEELSSTPFGSIMVDDLTYRKMMNYLLKNDVNIGILNNAVPMVRGASQIALFANNIIEKGTSQYKGVDFSFNDLTDEEKGELLNIQFVWPNLTNNWILGDGPTEKNTLFELEKLTQSAEVISLIKEIIDNAAGSSNVVIEDLKPDQLDIIRLGITQIVTIPRIEGFSFDEDLNPNDSLSGLYGFAYYSFLDEDLAQTFVLEDDEITSILPISTEDSKDLSSRANKLQRERFELKAFYYEYFRSQMSDLEAIINEYLLKYDNFIASARKINIIADYKRLNKYSLTVEAKPTIKFAELPYYKSAGMILDNPPIYPNVNVITYRGVSDKLSFFMNSGQGQIEIEPTTFSDEEDTFIANYRKSRKLNNFQPILYKSDEAENLGTIFEIRRLSVPPKNYESFREAKVVTAANTISTGKNLPAATYDELINSNTKYYYIFRVFDRRGTVSYPSGVMEIEIVENNGIIYPVIKPYEFKKQKMDTTKKLKRLLNVVPRITQVLPPADTTSYSELTAGATTILGREEEALFGKQFKLRLTSKKTGKVVDLNLNFNANVVERAEAE